VLLPFVLSERDTNLAGVVAIYAIIAVSLVLLTGWAGEISLGQVAFVAIGSAAAGAANVHWQLDPVLSFLLAGAVGAAASIIIGLPALRIRGLFLAVTTMAFAVATSSFLLNRDESLLGIKFDYLPDSLTEPVRRLPQWTPFGSIDIASERQFYFVCVVALLAVLVAVRGLQHSRTVRDLIAPRENERNAQAFGLSPTRTRLLAFAAGRFLRVLRRGRARTPAAGGGPGHLRSRGEPAGAHHGGGRRAGLGPRAIMGATFLQSTVWFSDWVPQEFRPVFQFAGSGIGLIVVLWLLPGGLGSLLYRVRDRWLRNVARPPCVGRAVAHRRHG